MAFPLIVDTARNAQGMFLVDPATGQPSSGSGSTSQNVQGAEATGVTQTAKPVVIGMTDATTGNVRVAVGSTTNSDGAPAGSGLNVRAHNYVFNGTSFDRMRGDTTGTYTVSKGSATIATNQVSVATSNTQIVAARAGRGAVTITNHGTTDVFIGVTGVTASSGVLLTGTKGASITLPTSAAIFGIVGTGSQTVSFIETY